jgi:hypothetical protein
VGKIHGLKKKLMVLGIKLKGLKYARQALSHLNHILGLLLLGFFFFLDKVLHFCPGRPWTLSFLPPPPKWLGF